jgi:cysteine desulfuration protein SufE
MNDETPPETVEDAKQTIIDEFGLFGEWTERYEYIIELGRSLPELPPELRTDNYKVPGCQSQVWFHAGSDSGLIHFRADSDAVIVRGLIALLLRVYSGRTPDEIIATSPDFFEQIELGAHLTGSRANGLAAMVTRIHEYGRAYRDSETEGTIDPEALN